MFCVLVGLIVASWLADHRAEDKRLRVEIQKGLEAVRAAGQPVTSQDLAKLFSNPPPGQDAARLLAPALDALAIPEAKDYSAWFGFTNFLARRNACDQRTWQEVAQFLNDNRAAMGAVPWDQITNAWIGANFADGFPGSAEFQPHRLRQLVELFCLSAFYEAESGHGTEAARQLSRSLVLTRVLPSGILLHHLIRRSYEQRVCAGIERVINQTELSTNDLILLERSLADDHSGGLRESLMSLRCREIWAMETIQTTSAGDFVPTPAKTNWTATVRARFTEVLFQWSGRIYQDSDFVEMLDLRAKEIAALDLPLKQRFAEFQQTDNASKRKGRRTYASELVHGSLYNSMRLDAETLAWMEVTRTALAVERWRLAHDGQSPESLTELVPDYFEAIPLDPFDQQPLPYRKLPKGFVVYSIGADFADDHARERLPDQKDPEHYDLTFFIER